MPDAPWAQRLARLWKDRYGLAHMEDTATPTRAAQDVSGQELDRVDAQLLALVGERLRMGETAAVAGGPPLRPGQEIKLLRKLISGAPQAVEPELVLELWRALVNANTRRQRVVDVVVGGGRGDPTRLFDIARRHFGARTRIQHVGEPQVALQRAVENPETCVAVVPWLAAPGVGAWWPALSERRFHGLHLVAGLPVLAPAGDAPEAALFAAAQPEEAGQDMTLLLAFDPHHRLQRALNEIGLAGKEISRAEPRVLVRIEGFVAPSDTRAAALTSHGLDGVRVLGSYARI